jgi:nucleotide-binding universal stress UspA family protein
MNEHPFKNILLATEQTEFDAGAERIAFAMAQRCGIPLRVVVPVVSNPEYEAEAPEQVLRAEQEVARRIDALRQRAAAHKVQLDIHVRRGIDPHQEIVAEARESHADLIVVRRRGKPGFLAKLLVGEMVSKVIRDVSCNVLLVPRTAEFWQTGILAAVGDTPNAPNIAKVAGNIAAMCALPLTLLSVAENEAVRSKLQSLNTLHVALASAATRKASGRVVIGKPVEQTATAIRETAADLVIIGRQRYHVVPFALGGKSIMQQIVGATDVPTLIVPG